ncbi:MAG: hypothetical protein Unbinned2716contig1004_6 [Prokaryotic dsDNA virus sp.]|nr:MAG: hypothetical protein Unbinned2716contig1004_6 [Prokaryotic dsDNA virus sp.]|tara:strand:- start:22285 stop:22590 length:306 start_codon:yes stop_codon:yes gene_type:complete
MKAEIKFNKIENNGDSRGVRWANLEVTLTDDKSGTNRWATITVHCNGLWLKLASCHTFKNLQWIMKALETEKNGVTIEKHIRDRANEICKCHDMIQKKSVI